MSEDYRIVELWRAPVKSMQGERLTAVDVGERGLDGDRQWALVDLGTGLTLTARRVPELLFATGRLDGDGGAVVELPDGRTTADDGELSAWLGRDVALRHAGDAGGAPTYEIAVDFEDESGSQWVQWQGPATTFHDSTRTRVSIVSTATIGAWKRRRFRTNVVVEAGAPGAEDALVGRRLGRPAGAGPELDIVTPIDRCVMTTRPQPGGIERDLDVLRTINAERAGFLAVGALVAVPGRLAVGDELRVLGDVADVTESGPGGPSA